MHRAAEVAVSRAPGVEQFRVARIAADKVHRIGLIKILEDEPDLLLGEFLGGFEGGTQKRVHGLA